MYIIHLEKPSLLLGPTSRNFNVTKLILDKLYSKFASKSKSLWHKCLIIRYRILIIIFIISTIQTVPFHSTCRCSQVFRYSQWVITNSSLLGCDSMPLGDCYVKCWRHAHTSGSSDDFHVKFMVQDEANILLQNIGNHSPRWQNLTFQKTWIVIYMLYKLKKKQLYTISMPFITQEFLRKWKTTEHHVLLNIQVFRYMALCHQVSTFQRIVLLSSSEPGSPSVPFVAILDPMNKALQSTKTTGTTYTTQCRISHEWKLHARCYANFKFCITFSTYIMLPILCKN